MLIPLYIFNYTLKRKSSAKATQEWQSRKNFFPATNATSALPVPPGRTERGGHQETRDTQGFSPPPAKLRSFALIPTANL